MIQTCVMFDILLVDGIPFLLTFAFSQREFYLDKIIFAGTIKQLEVKTNKSRYTLHTVVKVKLKQFKVFLVKFVKWKKGKI